MAKLFVLGLSPLPFENTKKNFGPGIRTWQFVQPLLQTNHEILLVANRIPYIYPDTIAPEIKIRRENLTYIHVQDNIFRNKRRIQELHDAFNPDAILAATIFSTSPLTQLDTTAPVWIDLFGHVMAEAQAKAFRYRDDSFLDHFLQHEIQALGQGDIFSTVSRAQKFATIGELGLLKRLTSKSTGYEFCHTIPCAMEPELYEHTQHVVRGDRVPQNAFVVLWSGGYNTWTDTDTLIKALEIAMKKNPDIWFVSTGGQIDGHDEKTYPAFVDKVKRSPFCDRFILEGWIEKEIVHNYYFEANIGINIDHFMYEGMFGSKNRVLDWMRAGLPALMGQLCELSYELPTKGLAYNYPLHAPDDLANILLNLAQNRKDVAETGSRAMQYGLDELNFKTTTKIFRDWLNAPSKAPDTVTRGEATADQQVGTSPEYVQNIVSELERNRHHIQELESYIRHLESYIDKHEIKLKKKTPPGKLQVTQSKSSAKYSGLVLKNSDPKISVVIVTWNGIDFLDDCIKSVFIQRYNNLECIIIDNGSSDGSGDFVRSSYPKIILVENKKNRGFSRGVNQGLKLASGEIVVLLNQDAILQKDALQAFVDLLVSDPSIVISGCKILDPDGKTLQHAGGILHPNGLTDHYGAGQIDEGQFDEERDCDYVTGAAFAFKSALLEKMGYFDERFSPVYFEELDFCTRATRRNYRIRYTHKAVVFHHESTSTGKFSGRFYTLYHRNRLLFMLKHFNTRYFFGTFRRTELNWIRNAMPSEQVWPLIRAYVPVIHRFFWIIIRDIMGRNR